MGPPGAQEPVQLSLLNSNQQFPRILWAFESCTFLALRKERALKNQFELHGGHSVFKMICVLHPKTKRFFEQQRNLRAKNTTTLTKILNPGLT